MPGLPSAWHFRLRTVLVWCLRALQTLLPLEEAGAVETVVTRLQRPAQQRAARLHASARPACPSKQHPTYA